MSLINDALKRAKQAQKKHAPPPAVAPMRPVAPAPRVNVSHLVWLPILLATLLVFVGGILIVMALNRGFRIQPAESLTGQAAVLSQTTEVPLATSNPASTVALQLASTNAPPYAAVVSAVVTQTAVTVESSNPVPVVQIPSEPQLPKLQGILFNPVRPTAFLNGRSVMAGGRVGEYTVVAITKQAVTIERAGRTNVLAMEE